MKGTDRREESDHEFEQRRRQHAITLPESPKNLLNIPTVDMIPTPDISHLTAKDYDLIYEPAGILLCLISALITSLSILRGHVFTS